MTLTRVLSHALLAALALVCTAGPAVSPAHIPAREVLVPSVNRAVCNLLCIRGERCVVDKCYKATCRPVCSGVVCKDLEVCVADSSNRPKCVYNRCALVRCGADKPRCIVNADGSAQCVAEKICPVHIRFQPTCCLLQDGTITTQDDIECTCRNEGRILLNDSCPSSKCDCPVASRIHPEICCSLKDGTKVSATRCQCNCLQGDRNTTPPPTRDPPIACKCPVTTSGICCRGADGNYFHTASESCCTCLGGKVLGAKLCPVKDVSKRAQPTQSIVIGS